MIAEARRRAAREGLDERCRFLVAGVEDLALARRFSLVLAVTVLQHVVAAEGLDAALARLAAHLAPGGDLVLLEAAPERPRPSCHHEVFRARTLAEWQRRLVAAGLVTTSVRGVDPMPCKLWLLPHYRRLPRPLALAALLLVTAISLPIDVVLGRRLVRASWHKVLVLAARPAAGAGG
jgi:SAM-dependent methyltransferase